MSGTIGTSIKNLRIAQQVTQADLAKAVGISVQAVSKWECGGTPDIQLLPAIADFFDVTIDQLFGRDSNESTNISHLVVKSMERTQQNEKMLKAMNVCWSVFKGLTAIPCITNTAMAETEDTDKVNAECTRCRVASNDYTAYVCADPERFSFFMIKEPDKGYSSLLLSADDYSKVFSYLSDPEAMSVLLFLCRRESSPFSKPFSAGYVCKALNISLENVKKHLKKYVKFGWFRNASVELAEGEVTLYTSWLNESMLAFLYYAAEVTYNFKLWHMSNTNIRQKPMIT